jgi:hypothetical protein
MPGGDSVKARFLVAASGALLLAATQGAGIVAASAPVITGCSPTACTPGTTVGLTTTKGVPVPAAAGAYAWGMATEPDGSILVGDYWNYRIDHFNADGSEATPFVVTNSKVGFGPNTNQAPFGICVDKSGGPYEGYIYMTEGSLYNVNQYDPNGNWVTTWGTNKAVTTVPFQYPSQCTVGPNGLVYIANQWGTPNKSLQGIVVLDPRYHVTAADASTSAGSTAVSAPDAGFTAGDVGAPIKGSGIPTGDTIVSVTSSTQAVMATAASGTSTTTVLTLGNAAVIDSPPAPNSFVQPRSLAFDSAGNLWVADEGHKRVDIFYASSGVNLDGKPNKTIPSPPCDPIVVGCTGTTFDMRGLAVDTASQLAFVTNGQGCVVSEFNANPSSPNYGQFLLNFGGVPAGGSDCGTANGQFEDGARDIAVSGTGQVWVADLGSFRAQLFDESGNFLSAVPNPPAPPPTGGFNGPRGAAFDTAGDMFVSDMYNERIEEFTPNGSGGFTFDQVWGMRGNGPGQFNYPRLACWDPFTALKSGGTGALIVTNTDSNMIVAWNPSANPPAVVWSSSAGTPPVGTLATPYGVACDPATGDVYVANSNAKDVVVFDSAGNQLGTMGSTDKLGFTRGIWVDSDGSVWVDNDSGGNVYHYASWANGGAELGSFNVNKALGLTGAGAGVFGIAGDANYLYVALSSINEVGQFTRAGTLVGTFGGYGTKLGTMRTPQGLTWGTDGKLYVVEENNNRVSQWTVP